MRLEIVYDGIVVFCLIQGSLVFLRRYFSEHYDLTNGEYRVVLEGETIDNLITLVTTQVLEEDYDNIEDVLIDCTMDVSYNRLIALLRRLLVIKGMGNMVSPCFEAVLTGEGCDRQERD